MFLLGAVQKMYFFATRGKKHRKYCGFGLPKRKNIGIYGVFRSERFTKTRKHHLFDDFWPLRDWEKNCRGNGNNNNGNDDNNNDNNDNNNDDNNNNNNNHNNSNSNSQSNSNSTVVFGLWGAKNIKICGVFFFVPKALKTI